MTRFGWLLSVLTAVAIGVAMSSNIRAEDEHEAGLVGEYFQFANGVGDFPKIGATQKPTLVRIDKQINFEDVTGDFYGAKMIENFYTRWTGVLRVEKAGSHEFFLESDDGSRLSIDGKQIVDNGGVHAMQEQAGKVDLTAGDHEIKVEFFQGGGEAGVKFSWHPPGGKREPVSEKALFHKKGSENIEWDKKAWGSAPKMKAEPKGGGGGPGKGKIDKMEYGNFLTGTIEGNYPVKGNVALKGLCIKLTKETTQAPPVEGKEPGKMASVCFDTDLLRVAYGWKDGYLVMPAGRDGLEGHPYVMGTTVFGTKAGPGWGKGDDFKDPRAKPWGPLPADWAKYKGLYINGDKTVLSYKVGSADVLEMPGFEVKDGAEVFSRTFSVGKSNDALNLLVCEQDKGGGGIAKLGDADIGADKTASAGGNIAILSSGETVIAVGIAGSADGAKWEVIEGGSPSIHLKLAAGAAAKFTTFIWSGPKADLAKFSAYLKGASSPEVEPMTKGGPPRWTPEITLQGTLGDDAGPFAVDTVTVPLDNAWNAYMRITGIDFFEDGRAAVCTMSGDVWIISGIDSKLEKVTWKRFATGLFQTLGIKVVDGLIYTTGRDQITRFHDFNNDGEADFYECFNNDCCVGNAYHEFCHDLHTDSKGNFYYAKGSNLGSAGSVHNGTLVRVSKDGSKSEVVAVGFRAPNGMCVGPHDEITTGDNQGNWTPSSPINWIYPQDSPLIKPGELGFYGFRLDPYPYTKKGPRINPICWIPYNIDNSCGGQVFVTSDKWGPFKDDLLHMSYGQCKLFHVMRETIGDEVQGGTTMFPLTFASGTMRARFNKIDGQLYVVGMRGWQTSAPKAGCVQRVRYTGKPVHMPKEFHVTKTGIDVTFTDTLDPASANDEQTWSAVWFNLHYTADYGSPEFNVSDDKKKGREPLPIKGAKLSVDGKTVSLEIPGLKPVNNIIIKYKLKFADGAAVSQDLNVTINKMP